MDCSQWWPKMETTLLVSSKLTFSESLRCLNLALWWVWYLKRDCTSQLVLLLQAKVPIVGNSNSIKILRVPNLKRQVMSFPLKIASNVKKNDNQTRDFFFIQILKVCIKMIFWLPTYLFIVVLGISKSFILGSLLILH